MFYCNEQTEKLFNCEFFVQPGEEIGIKSRDNDRENSL